LVRVRTGSANPTSGLPIETGPGRFGVDNQIFVVRAI